MILQSGNNRLLIYFFYDKAGIVDDYIVYMLNKLKPNVRDIIFVSNGNMTQDSKYKVEPLVSHVIERDNKGMDVMAYKTAIEYVGYKKLSEYDELIMMNFTIMGPVTSLEDMFLDMDSRDIDFWGLTLFHGCDGDPFNSKCEYGYLPLHIQSHFIAVRKNMFESDDFKAYWDSRKDITYYSEAIGKHEAVFTKHFNDKGYRWDVYSDTRGYMDYTDLPIISMPVKLIRDLKCPVFKRRNFFQEYFDIMNKSTGEVERELYDYLSNNTDYDVNLIWDNMLRVQNIADIKKAMQLNYVLSSKAKEHNEKSKSRLKYIIFVTDKSNIYSNFKWVENLKADCSYIIYSVSQEVEEAFKKQIVMGNNSTFYISDKIKDSIDRLALVKSEIADCDIVCFVNDFRDNNLQYDSVNESYLYRAYSSLVCNEIYVENLIRLFDENERLGLLVVPPPSHADYYPTLGCYDWGDNFEETTELAKILNIKSDIKIDNEPVVAYGHMFYARPEILKKMMGNELFEYRKGDNTDLAVERLYSYAAQDEGYYTATVMPDFLAEIEITNLQYMLTDINRQAFALFGVDTHFALVNKMREFLSVFGDCDPSSIEIRVLRIVRKIVPRKLIGKMCRGIVHIFRRG